MLLAAAITTPAARGVDLDPNGCRILSKLPEPGVHPRVFLTADEYPRMRERLKTPRFNKVFSRLRDSAVNSCMKGKGREFADKDFKDGVSDEDILAYFKSGEGRNMNWGVASVHAVLEDDKELQAIMRRTIVNYARIILASKERGIGGNLKGKTGKLLNKTLNIWKHDRWDVGVGWTFGAAGYATAYDVLHNSMSKEERSVVRKAIAAATKGRKSYGNGMPRGFASSNHYGYHGDLAVMLAAIEGEPGFDKPTWDGIVQVLRDYWEIGYTPFGVSREDGYGPNLGLRGGGRGYLVLARRGYNIFATEKYRRFLDYMVMDFDPYPGGHLNGGASGGPYGELYPTSTLMARFMYPKSPAANVLYRHMMGEDYDRRLRWQGLLDYLNYGSDWQGPADREEMLKTCKLALSRFYPVRGKFIARSDWSNDAMYLTFDARPDAHLIGHDKVDRGNFSMSALGRVWAFSGDFHIWNESRENSLVHIDGTAQAWKAPGVRFLWHGDDGTVAGGAADLKYAYDWQWTPPWPKWGREYESPWEPETNGPLDLGWPKKYAHPDLCPASIHGSQSGYHGQNNLHRRPYNKVKQAMRSAFLVRSPQPYALICDDIRKDSDVHLYEWVMQLPTDLVVASKDNNRLILKEARGDRRMLVHVLKPSGCAIKTETYEAARDRKRGAVTEGRRLIASIKTVAPEFRVLLLPVKAGQTVPGLRLLEKGAWMIKWPNRTDVLRFRSTDDGSTTVKLAR
jgi:hypothetical protein